MIQSGIFYLFAAILLAAAVGVISFRNPVYSALCLVLAFMTSSVLWILLEAEFLGIVLVLVYVGAVMVLFLFVVMMLDINIEQSRMSGWTPFGVVVALIVAGEIGYVVWTQRLGMPERVPLPVDAPSNTEALGAVLYTDYVYAFELASLILLVAIIGAITLTMRKRPGLKVQDISAQVAVQAKDRIRVVPMKSETKPEAGS